jgi:hypothetical protein
MQLGKTCTTKPAVYYPHDVLAVIHICRHPGESRDPLIIDNSIMKLHKLNRHHYESRDLFHSQSNGQTERSSSIGPDFRRDDDDFEDEVVLKVMKALESKLKPEAA